MTHDPHQWWQGADSAGDAERVARALLNWAREVLGSSEQRQSEGEPGTRRKRPFSNAERQQRFRDKRKCVTRATPRNESNETPEPTPPLAPDVAELFEQEEEHFASAG